MSKKFTKFGQFLKELREETTSGDIATVDNKLDLVKREKPVKGKKCKAHNNINCTKCSEDVKESRWN